MDSKELAKELEKRGCPLDCVDVFVTVVSQLEAKLKIATEALEYAKQDLEELQVNGDAGNYDIEDDECWVKIVEALHKIKESE